MFVRFRSEDVRSIDVDQVGPLASLWRAIGVTGARHLRNTAALLGAAAAVMEAGASMLDEIGNRHRVAAAPAVWQRPVPLERTGHIMAVTPGPRPVGRSYPAVVPGKARRGAAADAEGAAPSKSRAGAR